MLVPGTCTARVADPVVDLDKTACESVELLDDSAACEQVALATVRACTYSAGEKGTPGTCAEEAQVSVAADKEACESITELANDVACQAVVSDIVAIAGTWVVDKEVTLATTC
jgi:hypothetical protein